MQSCKQVFRKVILTVLSLAASVWGTERNTYTYKYYYTKVTHSYYCQVPVGDGGPPAPTGPSHHHWAWQNPWVKLGFINYSRNFPLSSCCCLSGIPKKMPIGFANIWTTHTGSKFNMAVFLHLHQTSKERLPINHILSTPCSAKASNIDAQHWGIKPHRPSGTVLPSITGFGASPQSMVSWRFLPT